MSTALIDADVIAYVCAVRATNTDWADEIGDMVDEDKAARQSYEKVAEWAELSGCDEVLLCFSSRSGLNFRKQFCPGYKANRGEKPAAYWSVVDAMEAEFDVARIEGMEADDVMGVLATDGSIDKPVIVTIDKDLLTIPGRVFNPNKTAPGRPWRIPEREANRHWMSQALTGDATDGYKGCPGIGPKKAAQALAYASSVAQMWDAVIGLYRKAGLGMEDALLNTRMARILRAEDYSRGDGTIRLWGPSPRNTEYLELEP